MLFSLKNSRVGLTNVTEITGCKILHEGGRVDISGGGCPILNASPNIQVVVEASIQSQGIVVLRLATVRNGELLSYG